MPQTPTQTTTAQSTRAILLDKPKHLALSVLGVRPFGSKPRQSMTAALHGDEDERPGLNEKETAQLRGIRRFGATGSVLMAIGALGAGAQPVLQNPTAGLRVLSLPGRMPTVSLTMTMTGTVLVVLAWLMMGRFAVGDLRSRKGAPRRMSRSQLDRTLLLWILPLSVAPPMFSRDVYSYLAQSEIAARGLDPYLIGPKAALGVDHVLTRTVPTIWRDTPAPYGPFFLWLGRGISSLTGDNIVAGIFLHRLLVLFGVALIVWALPRLAKRCGVSAVSSLWLGAANPLLLFHLVAGIHNEALMLGLMLAGIEVALRAVEGTGPIRGRSLALLIAGSGLIALSATVKIPSLLALGFVGMALSRRWGANWKAFFSAAALLAAVTVIVIGFISVASGLGMGWVNTLNTATVVRSWMSIPTILGVGTGLVGVLLGLGDHTTAILTITRPIAYLVAVLITARMMMAVYMGRIHAVGGLGIALGAIVLLFPVVQPWYLLWAILPLAAWATAPIFRVPAVVFTSIVSVMLMSNGAEYLPFMIVQAVVATIITAALLIYITRKSLPWRIDKPVAEITKSGPADQVGSPGAYADSP